ncbi:hypothetical protein OSB04_013093 [Centaurea solstitialis]|uniref:non-specific serine/threonine protein kinase n=1 Tax=Centaurea solstitialis TaxID=347529 RepID=A0AA38TCL2_9ASTR|nr:hypothetical protein OSB04_013093 [Centaurea solstitialis]
MKVPQPNLEKLFPHRTKSAALSTWEEALALQVLHIQSYDSENHQTRHSIPSPNHQHPPFELSWHPLLESLNPPIPKGIFFNIGVLLISRLGPRNQPNTQLYTKVAGTHFYLDPIYNASDILRKKADVYSFGVVMFEMLSGMPAYQERSFEDGVPQYLINRVRLLAHRYSVTRLNELIDPKMKDHIDIPSSDIFIQIAHQCISLDVEKRPTMDRIIDRIKNALENQEQRDASTINIQSQQYQSTMSSSGLNLENFLIPLAEIKRATKNFSSKTQIGAGGFGNVYRGQLSECWQNRMAAIKRLGQDSSQGAVEFHNELKLISTFHHQNIIGFIGYCVEDNEIIIVLEYAINGSIDHYLGQANKNRCLTWAQRLKICLGAASGLNYLHSGLGDDGRVIHRDPKSSNILLDENMEAKVCDFGLSVVCPRNQPHIKADPAGTYFYVDPYFLQNGLLREESDVYTFGLVLFEMLRGCCFLDSWNRVRQRTVIWSVCCSNKLFYNNKLEKRAQSHLVTHTEFQQFQATLDASLTKTFTEINKLFTDGLTQLSERIRGIEETCQVAARRPTRRHDDHDDHDHHEGERKCRRDAIVLTGSQEMDTEPELQSTSDFLSSVQEEIPAEGGEERGVRFSGASSSMSEIDRVLELLENVASDIRDYQVPNEEINDARCGEDSKLKDMFDDVEFDFEKEEPVEDVEGPMLEEVLPQDDLMPVDPKKVELWERMKASSGKFLKKTEWNRFTRANEKYLEEKYKNRFRYHERKLSYVKLYGIENLKEELRREYIHMRKVNKQRKEELVSDYKFVAVKSYKTNKLSSYFYPVITFTRDDGKEYVITEADFQDVSYDVIFGILYDLKGKAFRSEEEIIALTTIVRHIKASISLAHLYDFQLGLENWTSKLFCHKPQRSLIGDEKDLVMYTVFYDADETRISCVYPDGCRIRQN